MVDCICCNNFVLVMMLGIPGRNCKAAYKSALSWAGPSSLSAFPAWRTAGRELYGRGDGEGGLRFGSSSAPVLDTWQVLDLSGPCCNHLHFSLSCPIVGAYVSCVLLFIFRKSGLSKPSLRSHWELAGWKRRTDNVSDGGALPVSWEDSRRA